MLFERKLTERELDHREVVLQNLLKNKRNLVKKYGKDAEKVMYGIATKKAKKKIEQMNLDNIKELVRSQLQGEAVDSAPRSSTVDFKSDKSFSGGADYGSEISANTAEDNTEVGELQEGHGLDQGDVDFLQSFVDRMGYDKEPVKAEEFSRLKKILKFILKSNILQDKTRDLSKGKVNEDVDDFEVDNAIGELGDIIRDIDDKADEAREIVRQVFPKELSRLDAYGAFNMTYSNNRYDVTLGRFVERLEEEGYEIEDGEVYVNEEKEDINKILKAQKIIKKILKDEGGAAGLKPIVDALKGLKIKKDELIKLLKKTVGVVKHRHGDYILKPIEEGTCGYDRDENGTKLNGPGGLGEDIKNKIDALVREKLTKKSDVGDFVDDFKKSDAKQFKGKSAKKKKEMAVAAYLAKQNEK